MKTQPNAIEVEINVIGSMLMDPEAVVKVFGILKPDHFYDPKHRIIFEAMDDLFAANNPIDTVSIFQELKKNGKVEQIGGAAYLSQLSEKWSSSANVEYHSRIVLEKFMLRKTIEATTKATEEAYKEKDVDEIINTVESSILDVGKNFYQSTYIDSNKLTNETLAMIEEIAGGKSDSLLYETGYVDLDDILGGFVKSDLIVIAARPSMGKTAFALCCAKNIQKNAPVGIFSLEMAARQLNLRYISEESGISANAFMRAKVNLQTHGANLSRAVHRVSEYQIFIDDSTVDISVMRSQIRRMVKEKGVKVVLIDYIQLMHKKGIDSREREVAQISGELKVLAKELNIPIVVLSQLNRAVENRSDRRPMLSDLRESGAIEQDADVVMFLYRPEYYGIMQDEAGNSTENLAEVIVAKQRMGPIGDVKLQFNKKTASFNNLRIAHHEDY